MIQGFLTSNPPNASDSSTLFGAYFTPLWIGSISRPCRNAGFLFGLYFVNKLAYIGLYFVN